MGHSTLVEFKSQKSIELNAVMSCGVTSKNFNTENERKIWYRLHTKTCNICKNDNVRTETRTSVQPVRLDK